MNIYNMGIIILFFTCLSVRHADKPPAHKQVTLEQSDQRAHTFLLPVVPPAQLQGGFWAFPLAFSSLVLRMPLLAIAVDRTHY